MNIGNGIRELRKHQGRSQNELAESAGITQAALSAIENGKRPGIGTLKKICTALKVPESLVYVMGMEKGDVPKERRALYDELYPVIITLVKKVVVPEP